MDTVATRPWRFREFRDPIFLIVNFLVWLIFPNPVSVWIFGIYGGFYLIAVLLKSRKYDGDIMVSKTDIKTIFGLNLAIPPERLAMQDEVTLKILRKDEGESQS